MEKKERTLKVYGSTQSRTTNYCKTEYKDVPMILLKGEWLKQCGFNIADHIIISVQNNQLTITKAKG